VSYKNDAVRNKFAKADTRPSDRKLDYRGRSGEQVLKPGKGAGQPGVADRARPGGERPDLGGKGPGGAEGEEPSPLGDLAAQAAVEGYKINGTPIPYHGYYYRILSRQGATAPGGAYDYVVKGKMIGGFGLLAFPADYGNSGIMTFLVNQDGKVFQKDLGPNTTQLARKIESFTPDQTWTKIDAAP
jgi:hypothetical protein